MFFNFRVTNKGKAFSGPVQIEADTLEEAYDSAAFLYPTEDGWEVQGSDGVTPEPWEE